MSNLQGKCSRPAGFDPNHEGHSGWQAYDIARNNIAGWVQSTKPDIVQFMLGTNDVNIGKRNVQSILDSYTTMLNAMRAANPKVKVIVSRDICFPRVKSRLYLHHIVVDRQAHPNKLE